MQGAGGPCSPYPAAGRCPLGGSNLHASSKHPQQGRAPLPTADGFWGLRRASPTPCVMLLTLQVCSLGLSTMRELHESSTTKALFGGNWEDTLSAVFTEHWGACCEVPQGPSLGRKGGCLSCWLMLEQALGSALWQWLQQGKAPHPVAGPCEGAENQPPRSSSGRLKGPLKPQDPCGVF